MSQAQILGARDAGDRRAYQGYSPEPPSLGTSTAKPGTSGTHTAHSEKEDDNEKPRPAR